MKVSMIERTMMPEAPEGNITCERLYKGRITTFTIPDTSRKTVDAWGNNLLDGLRHNQTRKPFYVLHDFSSPLNVLTPYVYQWQDRIAHVLGNATGYVAIILPRTTFARVARLLIASRPPTLNPNLRLEVFYTREDGLTWLTQFLPE